MKVTVLPIVSVILGTGITLLVILGIRSHAPAMTALPEAAAGSVASTTPAIPGDNLTLGEDSNPTVGTYLIAYNGQPLYAYAKDVANASACTGTCLTTWKPYLVTSSANLVAESPIVGMVGSIPRSNGLAQVTYNGYPLYFYVGDRNEGVTGNAVDKDWRVARP